MTITTKPKTVKKMSQAMDFIQQAPDAKPKTGRPKGVFAGNKRQISLTIAPELLRKVDEIAQRTGQARAAIINLAIFNAVEGNVFQS